MQILLYISIALFVISILGNVVLYYYDKAWRKENNPFIQETLDALKEEYVYHFTGYTALHNKFVLLFWIGIIGMAVSGTYLLLS